MVLSDCITDTIVFYCILSTACGPVTTKCFSVFYNISTVKPYITTSLIRQAQGVGQDHVHYGALTKIFVLNIVILPVEINRSYKKRLYCNH